MRTHTDRDIAIKKIVEMSKERVSSVLISPFSELCTQ